VVVIDHDQGQSGASAADREGFQRLVAEVGLGKAGIVMGLEVSRLARNCADWHRLLEICALSGTLILDEDGLYEPSHYNDRLLLGLKGTMSEAELHVLRARLVGVVRSTLGVVGGFLLVPILAEFHCLPMRVIVAASIPHRALRGGTVFVQRHFAMADRTACADGTGVGLLHRWRGDRGLLGGDALAAFAQYTKPQKTRS
jgi:hypothetical protein